MGSGKRYNSEVSAATPVSPATQDSTPQRFSLRQRILLWLITWTGIAGIWLIAPTLRVSVSLEEDSPSGLDDRPFVYSFWHNCIFPAIFIWRNLGIAVLSSDSFDGEYTGRIIRKFGFVKIRGTRGRGAVRALLGMRRQLQRDQTVAFTIDGPKGPRYVAKPGPALLARATGAPMTCFHIGLENPWILKTWDGCMIPKPFSKALMRISRKIKVPSNADDNEMARLHAELQASLDRVREFAERNVHHAGSKEFPKYVRKLT